jgi:hypothetical protein
VYEKLRGFFFTPEIYKGAQSKEAETGRLGTTLDIQAWMEK